MDKLDARYASFALVREMLETSDVLRSFPIATAAEHAPSAALAFLTGEGSSRIFPAKHARVQSLRRGDQVRIELEGAAQASEYAIANAHLYAASNSGRTAEVVRLLKRLHGSSNPRPARTTALVASAGTPIGELCDQEFVLTCGREQAVAATKSVVEQALFYDVAFRAAAGVEMPDLRVAAEALETAMTAPIDRSIVECFRGAGRIYFSGRNDGVAEELTLKTNEITRRASAFLEGTYAVHGVEEVMKTDDVLVIVDPFPVEEALLERVFVSGLGLPVIAIAARQTRFPTLEIPSLPGMDAYLQLVAGWSLLVEIGIEASVNLDKPERARKIGNELEA